VVAFTMLKPFWSVFLECPTRPDPDRSSRSRGGSQPDFSKRATREKTFGQPLLASY